MTLTIDVPKDQEASLAAKAQAQGVSAEEYVRQVLAHDLNPLQRGDASGRRSPITWIVFLPKTLLLCLKTVQLR